MNASIGAIRLAKDHVASSQSPFRRGDECKVKDLTEGEKVKKNLSQSPFRRGDECKFIEVAAAKSIPTMSQSPFRRGDECKIDHPDRVRLRKIPVSIPFQAGR